MKAAPRRARTTFVSLVFLALAACTSQPPVQPSPGTGQTPSSPATHAGVLGLLEVKVEGIGGPSPTATAQLVQPGPGRQATTVLPFAGLSFRSVSVSFLDRTESQTRYVSAVFRPINATGHDFSNLTLYAVNRPGTTIGGTAIAAVSDAAGRAITDPALVRGFKPTHGMRPDGLRLEVSPNNADMQLFSPAEALEAQRQAAALPTPVNADVLEYGFVARNAQGTRPIAQNGEGSLTLAYKLPLVSPRSANPYSFNVYFVVADESVTRVSESVEEQGLVPAPVLGRSNVLRGAEIATALGSIVTGPDARYLCRPRTAGAVAGPAAYLVDLPGGTLDPCLGTGAG